MSERVPAQNKTSATPPQATQASSPLLHQSSFTSGLSESLGDDSNISKGLGGIQPKTIRRSLNWQNITVEAPSRGNGMSLPGGIQRQQEEAPAVSGEVSADSVQKSPLESSNLTISTQAPVQKPLIARTPFNGRNISVEAPSRGNGISLPGGIQRQQEEAGTVIGVGVSADSAQKSALESSNSTISTSAPAQKPSIARAPLNRRNIPVEAPPSSSASSTYSGGIQRLETSGVKEQEKSTESLQMQPEEEIQAKSSEGEPQEKENQNQELVQTKLTVGIPGDKYEQEADSMAAKVMTMPDSAIQQPIQRQTGEGTEAVQMQPLVNSITPLVQRESGEEEVQMKSGLQQASDGSSVASSSIESRLASSKGGGSALPKDVLRFMEPRFGADFSNIKVHTDSNAVQMNKEVGAQAFAHGGDIYYGAGKSPGNNELTAHELTHTIQQGAARRVNKEVRRQPQQEEEQETIQAKEISISGQEKSNQVSLSNKESSKQVSEAETETLAAKTLSSYNTNLIFNKELPQKPQEEEQQTTQEEPLQAKQLTNTPAFNNKGSIQRQPLAVTSVSPRIQGDFLGIGNPIDKIKGAIAGLAQQLPGYSLLTLILGKDPVSDAPVQRNATNLIRGLLGLAPNGDNIFNNLQQSGTLQKAFDWFNGETAKLNLTGDAIKGLFAKALNSLGISDAINPMGAFEKVKNVFVEPIGRIKNFAVSAGTKVMEFAFEGFLNKAGGAGAQVMGTLRKAGGAFSSILKDPVAFCGNLVGAVRGGCQKFAGNATTHLKNGLTGWLFGALAGAGLTLPGQFDTKGIVSVVLQVLGATYERLRGKLANKVGEQTVGRLEKTFDFLGTIVTGGLGAAWQKISEFVGNLQEMVIGGIKEWVMQSVITSAITKLISMFNPAGAIIQAVMAIYNTVMFFIERGSQIAALAEAVFNSIGTIAAGNVAGAANYVEQTMGRSLPVMISFLARLLGLGGVSEHIKNVIKKIQAPIENAMNKLASFIIEKGKSLFGKGEGQNGQLPAGSASQGQLNAEVRFKDAAGESHRMWMQKTGNRYQLMVASNPQPVENAVKPGGEFADIDGQQEHQVISKAHEAEQSANNGNSQKNNNPAVASQVQSKMNEIKPILEKSTGMEGGARPKELENLKTPRLDELEKREPGVSKRYVEEYQIYQSNGGQQTLVIYVEGRAARKLGRRSEQPAITAYNQATGLSVSKNNRTIEILQGNVPNLTPTDMNCIPDIFQEGKVVGEIKDVDRQDLDPQMKCNVRIAKGDRVRLRGTQDLLKPTNRFDLIVRAPSDAHPNGTHVSGPLRTAIAGANGQVYELI